MVCCHGTHTASVAGSLRYLFFTHGSDGQLPRNAPAVSRQCRKPAGQGSQRKNRRLGGHNRQWNTAGQRESAVCLFPPYQLIVTGVVKLDKMVREVSSDFSVPAVSASLIDMAHSCRFFLHSVLHHLTLDFAQENTSAAPS